MGAGIEFKNLCDALKYMFRDEKYRVLFNNNCYDPNKNSRQNIVNAIMLKFGTRTLGEISDCDVLVHGWNATKSCKWNKKYNNRVGYAQDKQADPDRVGMYMYNVKIYKEDGKTYENVWVPHKNLIPVDVDPTLNIIIPGPPRDIRNIIFEPRRLLSRLRESRRRRLAIIRQRL